jgi:cytoskeletal protein CcmA (bactofilin family)
MSCESEATIGVYVDGELSSGDVRRFETHLVTCLECRGRVLALREEASLLADALHEREPQVFRVTTGAAPAQGLALGFPATILAATVVLAVIGTVVESRLPGGYDLLNPLRLKGAYEMIFDVVFLIRDRAPGFLELALSIGAVLGLSALASFALGAVGRRLTGTAAIALVLVPGLTAPERAEAVLLSLDDETVIIAAGDVIEETVLFSGESVSVDGTIRGDLIVAADRLVVRGRIEGNVFVFARDVEVPGRVDGSLYGLAERARIEGEVGGLDAALERLVLAPSGRIGRDAFLVGDTAAVDGEIGRDLWFAGDELEVRGKVERNVDVRAGRLAILDEARIGGDVDAQLPEGDEVELASSAQIGGEVRTRPHEHGRRFFAHWLEPHFYVFLAIQYAASFLMGLLLYWLVPQIFGSEVRTPALFFRTLGFGFVSLVGIPIALLLTALTIVGIPIALLGVFVFVTAFYLADIVVGALIGRALLHPEPRLGSFGLALLVGLGIVVIGHAIPILGAAVGVVSLLLGLGMLVERAQAWRRSVAS